MVAYKDVLLSFIVGCFINFTMPDANKEIPDSCPNITWMQLVNAFERNDRQSLVLNARGRYLLLVMMREFFVGMNNIRDQARAALPAVEKLQLCTTPTVERPVLG